MNWRKSYVFCLFSIALLLLTSCSSLNFLASGKTPFKISANSKSEKSIVIEGARDFYFWGIFPAQLNINFEDESNRLGLSFPSYVSVEQNIGLKSFFYTVLTLGLYCPVDYKIIVLTANEDK